MTDDDRTEEIRTPCPLCKGEGDDWWFGGLPGDNPTCSTCGGVGAVPEERDRTEERWAGYRSVPAHDKVMMGLHMEAMQCDIAHLLTQLDQANDTIRALTEDLGELHDLLEPHETDPAESAATTLRRVLREREEARGERDRIATALESYAAKCALIRARVQRFGEDICGSLRTDVLRILNAEPGDG